MTEQTNLIKVTLSCPSIWDKYHGQHWRMFIFFSLLDSNGGFALYLPVAMVSPDTGALPMMVFFFYSCTPLIQLLWNRKLRLADLRANQLRFIEHTFWKKSQVFKHNVRTYLQQAIPSLNGCGSLLPQSHFCYLQPQSEDLKAEETRREQQRWVIRPFTVYEMKRHTISGHQKQDTKWSQRNSQSWDMTGLKHQHVEKENKDSLF